jgi:hypothetical protein
MKQALYKLGPCKDTRTKRKHESKMPIQRTNQPPTAQTPETARALRNRTRTLRAQNQTLEPKIAKQSAARAGQPLGSQAQDTAPAAGRVGAASMQLSTARAGQAGAPTNEGCRSNIRVKVQAGSASGGEGFTYYDVSPTAQVGDLTLFLCTELSLDLQTVMVLLRLDPEHKGTDPILKENDSLLLQSRQEDQAREPSSGSQLPADDATLKTLMELRGENPGIVYVHVKRPGAITRVIRMKRKHLHKVLDAYCEAESLDKRTFLLFRELNATETGESPMLADWVVFHAHIRSECSL